MDKKSILIKEPKNYILNLLGDLLKEMGFLNVTKQEDYIFATSNSDPFFASKKSLFLVFWEQGKKLTTKTDAAEVAKLITHIYEAADEIILFSRYENISEHFQGELLKLTDKKYIFRYNPIGSLVDLIDRFTPQVWTHNDPYLHIYEKKFRTFVEEDFELHNLKIEEKYKKMLNMFIEPKLELIVKDKDSIPGKELKPRFLPKSVKKSSIIREENYIIDGSAGTGKSTLLKQIGCDIISSNETNDDGKKSFPIIIKQIDLIENEYKLLKSIFSVLDIKFSYGKEDITSILDKYQVVLLIDSIDEFELEKQAQIIKELDSLSSKRGIRYYLATRNFEHLTDKLQIKSSNNIVLIKNFNLYQIQQFLSKFFQDDILKADRLLLALQENNILARLPITPLILSLISILYEEKQYEIPATITDIYDNFNRVLLGRSIVSSALDFFNITIKERVLSKYALSLLKRPDRTPMTIDEFSKFIYLFFKERNSDFDELNVMKILDHLTKNTDILVISNNKYVKFKHDSFIEYYASVEILKLGDKKLEEDLVENFHEFNWQNTAIFYAGHSKDRANFLEAIIDKASKYDTLNNQLMAIIGLGDLSQALYLTAEKIREKALLLALMLSQKTLDGLKMLIHEKSNFFGGMSLIDIYLMNQAILYRGFNSVTLKTIITKVFDDLYSSFSLIKEKNDDWYSNAYQLFSLSIILASERINNQEPINRLFSTEHILQDPIMFMLFDAAVMELDLDNKKELKHKFSKKRLQLAETIKFYIENPANKIRGTVYDRIDANKTVKIFTEGITDPKILEKAFKILTGGKAPYWNIKSIGGPSGGATMLGKFLTSAEASLDDGEIYIGIFDNDEKGFSEFQGLKSEKETDDFEILHVCLKKHKRKEIYAFRLPIPPERQNYVQEKQVFKFFELEHYFTNEYLEKYKMLKATPIEGIFEIGGSKSKFADIILKETDKTVFHDFYYLFREIDEITGKTIEYDID